jgi:hypothetical protein
MGKGFLFDDVRISTPLIVSTSGSDTPASSQTPTADGSAASVPLKIRSAKLDRSKGKVTLQLYCPKEAGLCAGTATIRADKQNVAIKGFDQNGGSKFPLTITVPSDDRARVRRASKVQALVLSRDAVGIATRLTRSFTR